MLNARKKVRESDDPIKATAWTIALNCVHNVRQHAHLRIQAPPEDRPMGVGLIKVRVRRGARYSKARNESATNNKKHVSIFSIHAPRDRRRESLAPL